jgi:uncharacterized membrane protein
MDIGTGKAAPAKNGLGRICALLYAAYLVGAAVQVSPAGAVIGSVAIVIAVCVAYAKRAAAKDTPFESHLRWLIRTFWIGGGVYVPVLTLIATIAIYVQIDYNLLATKMIDAGADADAFASGDPAKAEAAAGQFMAILMQQYGGMMRTAALAVTLPFVAWWISRLWRGYAALKAGKPVEKVARWI